MLRWIRRLRAGPSPRPQSSYRPRFEGLEDRNLLAAPVLDTIGNIVVPASKSRIVPITASDTDGDTLTYTVTSDNPNIAVDLHRGNPYLRMQVRYTPTGQTTTVDRELVFELLQDVAPNTVSKIIGLVNSGFYTNKQIYRLAPNFVIQGGGRNNAATGPGFPFDDEFNANAIFTGDAQLAMAKGADDTNSSEFFVTFGAQRSLDFNHTIFGQLVRGRSTIDEIVNLLPRTDFPGLPGSFEPVNPVTILNASLVQNKTDAVLTVRSTSATPTTGHVTVVVSDGSSTDQKQFNVSVETDSINNAPFLGPVPNQRTTVGTPLTFRLTATDLENGPLNFNVSKVNATDPDRATIRVNGDQVTITPNNGFVGSFDLVARVSQTGASGDDSQRFTVTVDPAPPQPPLVDPNLPPTHRFIEQVYQQLLERSVDASGLANWSGMLDRGVSREQVVTFIQRSDEYLTKAIDNLYQELLGRNADAAGTAAHLGFLKEGGTIEQLRSAIVTTQEYINLQTASGSDTPAEQVRDYLRGLYQDLLGRAIDTEAEAAYTRMLGLGFTRAEVVQAIVSSPEGRAFRADELYHQILDRHADPVGSTNAAAALLLISETALLADIVDSPEAEVVATRPR